MATALEPVSCFLIFRRFLYVWLTRMFSDLIEALFLGEVSFLERFETLEECLKLEVLALRRSVLMTPNSVE